MRSLGTRQVTWVLIALSLAVFMSSLDLFIVNLAFPYIGREYPGTSLGALSWVLNGYTIVFAAVLVPAGRWADRVGRRRVFVAGLVTFSVGSLLCGLAPGVPELIGARVIQAAGAGLMVPASLSLVLASVPAAMRGQAIGTWSAVAAMGAALGPVIGGGLVQASWRWVFWINLPVGLAAVLLATRVVPESKDDNAVPVGGTTPRTPRAPSARADLRPAVAADTGFAAGRPDLAGAALLALAVGLLALALVEAPGWGWGSASFIGILLASVASGAVIVARSRRHHSPVIELGLLRSRTFSGAFGASILYYAGFGAFVLNLVEFLTGVWHYSAVQAGLAIAPGPLMVFPFARFVAPRLAARINGPGRVAAIGCALNVAGQLYWLTQIQVQSAYLTHLLPAQLIGGAGVGLTIPSLIGAGSASLTPARFGTGSGILNMARQIGTVLGVAGLIAVLSHPAPGDLLGGYRQGVGLVIAFMTGAGVMCAGLLTARPQAAAARPQAAAARPQAAAGPPMPAAAQPMAAPALADPGASRKPTD